jgi:hypothetical protein
MVDEWAYLGAHNTVSSVEVVAVHMHAAALAHGHAAVGAYQLADYLLHSRSEQVSPAVDTVRGGERVVGVHRGVHPARHGFLQVSNPIRIANNLISELGQSRHSE